MSKTKAGGCDGREVDMHLRAECANPQVRLTSRTFVTVGMGEIIKKAAGTFNHAFKPGFELTTISA